jgi:hypothetical protein
MPELSNQSKSDEIDDAELDRIVDLPPKVPSPQAEAAFLEEKIDLEEAKKKSEIDHSNEDLDNKRADRFQRKIYGPAIFLVIGLWLLLVAYVVLAQGFTVAPFTCSRFALSDTVMVAFLTTSTATVIGMFLVVVNYLFPKR